MTAAFSYELGELIFDDIKNKTYYKFVFNDRQYVKVPIKNFAPNYKVPATEINSRYCDYTIKQFMVEKNNIEIGDIVRLDKKKINTSYNTVLVDNIIYAKTTQCELDAFAHKFFPNSDNGKVYGILKDLKNEMRESSL
jgi:hypothetical protein